MGFDDFIDSAPSVLGAGLTTAACFAIPAAIPLAAMQGTVISDPAQIWHAGSRHADLAGQADSAKTQLAQAVDKRASADNWDGNDKNLFVQAHVEPYKTALDQTAQMHNGINSSMGTLAKVYMGAGILSATIGGIMSLCAIAVAGTCWIPGVDVATEGAATATAETSSGVFRSILMKLATLIGNAGRLLKSIKGLLALAATGYFGTKAGKTALEGNTMMPTFWPGATQPGGQAPASA
jgi:hypothetical protein